MSICERVVRVTTGRRVGAILIAIALAVLVGADADNQTKADKAPTGWRLVWSDEFSGNELNGMNWSRCKRGPSDWDDTMSDDPRLLEVSNGVLTLRGILNDRNDAQDTAAYLTAGVTSAGKFTTRYGKVQVRARFGSAQGAWPAIWMLGSERAWPASGEIDLMEHLNFDPHIYQTVHSPFTLAMDKADTPRPSATVMINRDDWNTYGCEWNEEKIVFTVNGDPTFTYPRKPDKGQAQWPFDQPFYFIFSMQIGGEWVNESGPTNPDHYPVELKIDWVRVYQPIGQAD